jgi:hypothetical protein
MGGWFRCGVGNRVADVLDALDRGFRYLGFNVTSLELSTLDGHRIPASSIRTGEPVAAIRYKFDVSDQSFELLMWADRGCVGTGTFKSIFEPERPIDFAIMQPFLQLACSTFSGMRQAGGHLGAMEPYRTVHEKCYDNWDLAPATVSGYNRIEFLSQTTLERLGGAARLRAQAPFAELVELTGSNAGGVLARCARHSRRAAR